MLITVMKMRSDIPRSEPRREHFNVPFYFHQLSPPKKN